MTDPYIGQEVSLTLKVPESRRYAGDGPWIVIRGTDPEGIARTAAEVVGIDSEGLTLLDVALNAQSAISGLGSVVSKLGGKIESSDESWGKPHKTEQPKDEKSEAEREIERLLAAVESVQSVEDLQDLWARNQSAFADDRLMTAYRTKGKALTA